MTATIKEVIEIKPGMAGMKHAPGLVVVFDASAIGKGQPKAGMRVTLSRSDVVDVELVVGEAKSHGIAISLFFEGLTRREIPIGSTLSWKPGARRAPSRKKARATTR